MKQDNPNGEINLLAAQPYEYMAESLLSHASAGGKKFQRVNVLREVFPDGEIYHRIENPEAIRSKPAVLICGTTDDAAVLEAYNLCCALVEGQCSSLHLVIPYFGYSTMERAVKPGEVVAAKNIARLLSSVPLSAQGNYIYMVDLHSKGTQYYFEGSVHTVHLSTEAVVAKMIRDIGGEVVLASTDMGRAKWIEKLSGRLGLESAYLMKRRLSGEKTEVAALNANVAGKTIAIYDDMIRSGSSIINAAKAYKQAGAEKIFVLTTHGVFVPGALEKMKECGIIERIYCTNTHSKVNNIDDEAVKVYDAAEVILAGLEV